MIQCKIFKNGYNHESLQLEINTWLGKYPDIEITHVQSTDSSTQGGTRANTVYIFYKVKEDISL